MSLQFGLHSVKNILCNVFRGRFRARKIAKIVEVRMIQRLQDFVHLPLQDTEIDHQPVLAYTVGHNGDLHLPIVAVKFFAFSLKIP